MSDLLRQQLSLRAVLHAQLALTIALTLQACDVNGDG